MGPRSGEAAKSVRFDILTLFPGMFSGPFEESILKRAREAGLVHIAIHNIRDYAAGRHRVTDDTPYGGGGGMIMKPEPIFAAAEAVLGEDLGRVPVLLLTPQGELFDQRLARALSRERRLLLICGRYEGVDERVHGGLATHQVSIGDYVLSGGELPAMVVVEAVARLIPGVLGDPGATFEDSHAEGLLEYPHYTRPPVFRDEAVPQVLLSGNHAEITRWRRRQALRRTLTRRPDLLRRARLSDDDLRLLREIESEISAENQDEEREEPANPDP
ncbi:MAG: tRNA (guanosine(37)-N1)-methyltransferase TrmD [Anaerolineae bacterium]|nr:tRNA (guanosine(37)-N1)-methyltransferase TrmD [Anaerolineae bacterium]MDX9828711.1 tRNA (guanosine(37)-N1)-methyltransferase TrmD [Anaerolineae bacterium]